MASKKIKNSQQTQQKESFHITNENHSIKWNRIALGIILLTTFLIYYKAITFNLLMVWDDPIYISHNDHIKDFSWGNVKLLFTNYYVNNYHPLTMLFYAFEYKMGSGHAAIFHLSNILLHLINTYLVYVLIMRISSKNGFVAIITAAFFTVHPMHVESVAWVSELKDVLYTFFFLLSLIVYTDYLKSNNLIQLFAAGTFFILSCLSKSAAVILPLVLMLFDYYLGRKYSWKTFAEKLPFFAISIVFGMVAIQSQKGAIQDMAPSMSFIEHISIVSFSFVTYLYKAIIPTNLSAIYPYPIEIGKVLPMMYYLSILLIPSVLFFGLYSLRWGKDFVFSFLFFTLSIMLVLQVFPVGAATMADRYTYVPYIGVFYMIGKFFDHLSVRVNRNYILIFLSLSFFVFSSVSNTRIKKWKNDKTLFSDAKNKYQYCDVPYFIIGDYYLAKYKVSVEDNKEALLSKAIPEYENALKRSLIDVNKVKAYFNLGTTKEYMKDFAGSIIDFDKVLAIDKNYINAYVNRGNAKSELKDYKGSIEDLDQAIKLDPKNALAYTNRGITKYNLNDFEGAIKDFTLSLKIDNKDSKTYNIIGSAKYMLKDYEGAFKDWQKAIEINPKYTDAIVNRDNVKALLENSKK